jgi:hypothetical protein
MMSTKPHFRNPVLWVTFIAYLILTGYAMYQHEIWGDEFHSWNIAKGSTGFLDLISNTRYEGHPPVWYVLLWTVSKFTHDPASIQVLQFVIAALTAMMIIFLSPLPLWTRILAPFGYYFLFEYAVLSRNYAVGILPALCICYVLYSQSKYIQWCYYPLLFIMGNTHLLALILAGTLHLHFLFRKIEQKQKIGVIAFHTLAGIIILIPSLYFIFPPSDSALNTHFWMDKWNSKQLAVVAQAPLRAFVPIPAGWKYNFWDTQFLLELQTSFAALKWFNLILSATLTALAFFSLKGSKKSQLVFTVNLLLIFIVSVFIPFTNARHVGFIFIGFFVACWLHYYHTPMSRRTKWFVNLLLILQVVGGIVSVVRDIRYPFSNAHRVTELINKVPGNEKIVTDYWCLNALSAFADKPFYCLDLQKEMSYILWDSELRSVLAKPDRYTSGIRKVMQTEGRTVLYMISINSPERINHLDPALSTSLKIENIDKIEGAIEKGSNLYLYRINPLPAP